MLREKQSCQHLCESAVLTDPERLGPLCIKYNIGSWDEAGQQTGDGMTPKKKKVGGVISNWPQGTNCVTQSGRNAQRYEMINGFVQRAVPCSVKK